jgi:hypothetical protein
VTERELSAIVADLVDEVEMVCGPRSVALAIGDAHEFPKKRNYAYCTNPLAADKFGVEDGVCLIVVAPKILKADRPRVLGLLMHELGHAVDFQKSPDHPNHGSERRADAIAQHIWGIPIRYDGDTVQSICCGVHPRPAHLGL